MEKENASNGRRAVNQPASQPYIKIVNGQEKLCFKYNTKHPEIEKLPGELLEFCVIFNLDSVNIENIPEQFKADNCVYPNAMVPANQYKGNRYEYENDCNRLAWKFVYLNKKLLYKRRGLIQRAVDTYRNINKLSENRRTNLDEHYENINCPTVTVIYSKRGLKRVCKLRVDFENIEYENIEEDFKKKYLVFGNFYDENSFNKIKFETKNKKINDFNEIAIKIAYLNVDNTIFWSATTFADKRTVLRSAVFEYIKKYRNKNSIAMEKINIEDENKIS